MPDNTVEGAIWAVQEPIWANLDQGTEGQKQNREMLSMQISR